MNLNFVSRITRGIAFDFEKIYSNVADTVEHSIERRNIPLCVKNFLRPKRICFLFYFLYNFFIFIRTIDYSTIEMKHDDDISVLNLSLFLTILLIRLSFYFANIFLILQIYYLYQSKKSVLTRDDGLEEYLNHVQPRLKNTCEKCNVTKCIRSFHCPLCDQCILRYELHSRWFNICIGSHNLYPYTWVLKTMLFYFFALFLNVLITALPFGHNIGFLSVFVFVNIYMCYKFYQFSSKVFHNVSKNITSYEKMSWRRLAYLWKNEAREFYNPFDKGYALNWEEVYISHTYTTEIVPLQPVKTKMSSGSLNESSVLNTSVMELSNSNIVSEGNNHLDLSCLNPEDTSRSRGDRFKISKILL
jgi:hypothetical protein